MMKSLNTFKKALCCALAVIFAVLLTSCSGGGDLLPQVKEPTTSNTVRLTFPEGLTAVEAAALLEQNGVCPAADFIAAVQAPQYSFSYLSAIDVPEHRPFLLEGYVYPDTYEFYRNEDAQSVLTKFLKNFETRITQNDVQRAAELGYTVDEVLTIASIIQEEAIDSEMPMVSSVLHNRLNSSYGKLECDVTIAYLNDFVAPYIENGVELYREYYNAYKFSGLPAGPITNPGRAAIDAALYPAESDYYFFLTDESGGFHYSVTWDEHSRNVAKYMK